MTSPQTTTLSRAGRWLLATAAFVWLASCGNTSPDSTATSLTQSTTAVVSPSTVAPTTSVAAAATAPATSAPAEAQLFLVGLGDSIPGALHCGAPCRSYVEVLGGLAARTLGKTVEATNLATNDSLTSGGLLKRVQNDSVHRDAVANADIITIQIGFNDWQGPCTWKGHEECTATGAAQASDNLALILDQIATLRNGKPTATRVVTYFDNTVGDTRARNAWHYPADGEGEFHTWYAAALATFNAMMCQVAESHGAVCVGLVDAFNGPLGDRDAAELVGADHLHPTELGQDLIAATIDSAGYSPIG